MQSPVTLALFGTDSRGATSVSGRARPEVRLILKDMLPNCAAIAVSRSSHAALWRSDRRSEPIALRCGRLHRRDARSGIGSKGTWIGPAVGEFHDRRTAGRSAIRQLLSVPYAPSVTTVMAPCGSPASLSRSMSRAIQPCQSSWDGSGGGALRNRGR